MRDPSYSVQFQKLKQCQAAVKLHGVFLSWCKLAASSRPLQFRRVLPQDSRQVVQPFVRVGTYPTRNFACNLHPEFIEGLRTIVLALIVSACRHADRSEEHTSELQS